MRKLLWIVRQSLPLTYRSHYHNSEGEKLFAVWRMWFGRVFDYDCVKVA